jgi:hypothetical protein
MLNFGKHFSLIIMKQLEVFKKIGGIINELHEQYKYIESNNPEDINDLELELFVANAHFLKDHAEILNKLSQRTKAERAEAKEKVTQQLPPHIAPVLPKAVPIQPPVAPRQQATEMEQPEKPLKKNAEQVQRALEKIRALTAEKFFEPVVQQPKRDAKPFETKAEQEPAPAEITPAAPTTNYSFEVEEPQIRHELIVDETADFDEEEDLVAEEILETEEVFEKNESKPEELPVTEKPNLKEDTEERIAIELGKAPVAEPELVGIPEIKLEPKAPEPAKEKDEVFTINQRISAQLGSSNNLSEYSNAQPVTNLKQAITLNDKLLYIKDLFNGYSLAYSEAIEILNRFNTFEEANRFLNKNYTVKNNWDSKPETTDKFFALLKRRYS